MSTRISALRNQVNSLMAEVARLQTIANGTKALQELLEMTGAAYLGIQHQLDAQKRETEMTRAALMDAQYRVTSLETMRQVMGGRLV